MLIQISLRIDMARRDTYSLSWVMSFHVLSLNFERRIFVLWSSQRNTILLRKRTTQDRETIENIVKASESYREEGYSRLFLVEKNSREKVNHPVYA